MKMKLEDILALLISVISFGFAIFSFVRTTRLNKKWKNQELRLSFAEILEQLSTLNSNLKYEIFSCINVLAKINSIASNPHIPKEKSKPVEELTQIVKNQKHQLNEASEMVEKNQRLIDDAWEIKSPTQNSIVNLRRAIAATNLQINNTENYNKNIQGLIEVFEQEL